MSLFQTHLRNPKIEEDATSLERNVGLNYLKIIFFKAKKKTQNNISKLKSVSFIMTAFKQTSAHIPNNRNKS